MYMENILMNHLVKEFEIRSILPKLLSNIKQLTFQNTDCTHAFADIGRIPLF